MSEKRWYDAAGVNPHWHYLEEGQGVSIQGAPTVFLVTKTSLPDYTPDKYYACLMNWNERSEPEPSGPYDTLEQAQAIALLL